MFEKGDIVECIEEIEASEFVPKVCKGAQFIVRNTARGCCNLDAVDIGVSMIKKLAIAMCHCGLCGKIVPPLSNDNAAWYGSHCFRKIGSLYRTVEIASEITQIPIVSETSDVHNLR